MLNRRRFPRHAVTAGCAVAISAITLLANPASAAPNPGAAESTDSSSFSLLNPGMLEAMQRDLGLTQNQAQTRLANEARAMTTVEKLQASLGDAYAGSWVTGATSDVLVVATSDASKAGAILAAGAQPKIVSRSMATLEAAKNALDNAGTPPASTRVWYVDVKTNSVVVQSANPAEAEAFITSAGVDESLVRLENSAAQPRPAAQSQSATAPLATYNIRGGDLFYVNGSNRCTVGYSAWRPAIVDGRPVSTAGFVADARCGRPGDTTTGYNRVAQGVIRASAAGYIWVEVNSNWIPLPYVGRYGGTDIPIQGSVLAPVGATVCRSSPVTGWRCGTVQQHNATVTFPQGIVKGLTRTSVCSEPGDGGGPFVSGNQAQGIAYGGSGNCTYGGTTYFLPVNPALSALNLVVVRP